MNIKGHARLPSAYGKRDTGTFLWNRLLIMPFLPTKKVHYISDMVRIACFLLHDHISIRVHWNKYILIEMHYIHIYMYIECDWICLRSIPAEHTSVSCTPMWSIGCLSSDLYDMSYLHRGRPGISYLGRCRKQDRHRISLLLIGTYCATCSLSIPFNFRHFSLF